MIEVVEVVVEVVEGTIATYRYISGGTLICLLMHAKLEVPDEIGIMDPVRFNIPA